MRLCTGRTIRLAGVATAITFALLMPWGAASQAPADSPQYGQQPSKGGQSAAKDGQSSKEKAKLGVLVNEPSAFPGYTLVAPMNSKKTYLIDLQGRVVRIWESKYAAGQSAYLLENGHLLRAARLDPEEQIFGGMAAGGRVQEFTWDGELVWDFKFHNDKQLHHYDICGMPNGNVLLIVWEIKIPEEIVPAGHNPETVRGPGFPRFGAPGANRGGGTVTLADVLPPMLQFALELKPEQRRQLDDLQKDVVGKLEKVMNEGQKKQLRERRSGDSFGFGSLSTAGQLVPLTTQIALKLTAEQKKQLSAVQKDVDNKLDQVLDAGQKQRIKEMQQMSARGGAPGLGPGGPFRGPGGPPGFGGPLGGQPVFRAYRYGREYPGLAAKDLTPGKTVEELQPKEPQETTARYMPKG